MVFTCRSIIEKLKRVVDDIILLQILSGFPRFARKVIASCETIIGNSSKLLFR